MDKVSDEILISELESDVDRINKILKELKKRKIVVIMNCILMNLTIDRINKDLLNG